MSKALLIALLPCLLQQWCSGRNEETSVLVQLNDCTCLGYNQTFECTVFGGGFTNWRGTALSGCRENEIRLRHSQYINSQATGECNGGEIVAKSVRVSGSYYTSQLRLVVGKEMVNETIDCIHSDIQGNIISNAGQRMLNLTPDVPYPPPSNIHFEAIERNQIMFAWDEVADTLCSSIQYVIFATNCGVCPNTTTDTNITCLRIQSIVSVDANFICMLAVQTKICGYLLGERSEYVTVNISELATTEEDKSTTPTITSTLSSDMVDNGSTDNILVPIISSIMVTGVFLLLLVVVVLSIFISKQLKNKVNTTSLSQQEEFTNRAQNNQDGIYSLLQPPDDNAMVVYADIGQSFGEHGLRCETMLRFQDDKVEYAEIKSLNHESAPEKSLAAPLDINDLLLQFGTKLAPKWYQLGIAIGISEEMLDECSNHSPQEILVEVLDYWIKNYKPSWKDFAEVLKEIGVNEFASNSLEGKLQRQIKDDGRSESLLPVSTTSWKPPEVN